MRKPPAAFRWAKEQEIESLGEPQVFQGGLQGLAARRDIEAGEIVIQVPEGLLINEGTARDSDLVRLLLS